MQSNIRAGIGMTCLGVGFFVFSALVYPAPFGGNTVEHTHGTQLPAVFPYLLGLFFVIFGVSLLLNFFPDEYIEYFEYRN